ncbi:MAG: tryptophan synthase subunit alpha [Acidimicrobiia bacterium]|nr:tryptophan synthase subunit alpha [Acidimicrobiia bacterium]
MIGLGEALTTARESGSTLLLPFLTAGLPTAEGSLQVFGAMAEAGADGFEIGIPYTDPLMDGPVIQRAGLAALEAGMTLEGAFDLTRRVVDATMRPSILMTYVNPVLRLGVDTFCERASEAGADAVIFVDVPVDEAEPFAAATRRAGIGLVLFASPTITDERLDAVVAAEPVFIYGIAELGVTGERSGASPHVSRLAGRVRERCDIPLVLGVGISGPTQAAAAAPHADGIIVGSAVVRRVLEASSVTDGSSAAAKLVGEIRSAIDS